MKKTIILFCFIFCISCSQRKADSNTVTAAQQAEQQKEADSPFNPALRKAIDEFIDYVESKNKRAGKVYMIWAYKNVDEPPVLFLGNDYIYNDYIYNDVPLYYYIDDDYLILYPREDTDFLSGMIDIGKMKEFRDSIPGFDRHPEIGEESGLPCRTFEIVSPDSLRTMYTELTGLKKTAPRITPD